MYGKNETEASKSALLELGISLKRYSNEMVLVGGWAPYYISKKFFPHCGSIDIDLVLKTEIMEKYDSIRKSVLDLDYRQENEFRFLREVPSPVDDKEYAIHLDFLCEKEGLKYTKIRNVQEDLGAFAFEGCNIAFDFNYKEEIETVLPRDGKAKVDMNVADLVSSLVLKCQAINGRYKLKDFYDVYALTFFNGTPEKAAEYFNNKIKIETISAAKQKLVKHSISVLRERFEAEDSMGPFQVERFIGKDINRRQIYDQINAFLEGLNI
jgi:hypothetical protein